MGTADALPVEPVSKTTFVEDLTENQLAKAVSGCFLSFCFLNLLLSSFQAFGRLWPSSAFFSLVHHVIFCLRHESYVFVSTCLFVSRIMQKLLA